MHTILMRLSGPMQSWGVQSRFGMRDTGLEPSKSGIVGLLCAALGIPRRDEQTTQRLAALRMGVRVDDQGSLEMDYHTAQRVYRAAGGIKDTELSRRYYLAGATFLAGLESENLPFLRELQVALRGPYWPLYLGRKSFVPSPPVYLPNGLRVGEDLMAALKRYPWLSSWLKRYERLRRENPKLRIIIDDPQNGDQVRVDHPISFADRRFTSRRIRTDWIEWPEFDQQYWQSEANPLELD